MHACTHICMTTCPYTLTTRRSLKADIYPAGSQTCLGLMTPPLRQHPPVEMELPFLFLTHFLSRKVDGMVLSL